MMQSGGRTILAQGDLDGACFLYSLANAARCLTQKAVTQKSVVQSRWSKMLSTVGNAQDFLDGRVGTENSDRDWQLQESMAQQCMDILCPKAPVIAKTLKGLDHASVEDHVTTRSIVVMQNSRHWFCLVEVHQGEAYVACSARWGEVLDNPPKHSLPIYVEGESPRLNRTYNDKFATRKLEFFGRRAIKLTLSSTKDNS